MRRRPVHEDKAVQRLAAYPDSAGRYGAGLARSGCDRGGERITRLASNTPSCSRRPALGYIDSSRPCDSHLRLSVGPGRCAPDCPRARLARRAGARDCAFDRRRVWRGGKMSPCRSWLLWQRIFCGSRCKMVYSTRRIDARAWQTASILHDLSYWRDAGGQADRDGGRTASSTPARPLPPAFRCCPMGPVSSPAHITCRMCELTPTQCTPTTS